MPADPVVDVHAHIVPDVVLEAGRRGRPWHGIEVALDDGTVRWAADGRRHAMGPAFLPDVDERLRTMADHRVDVQVLSHMPAMFWYGADPVVARSIAREVNDSVAATVADAPDRLAQLAQLPLQDPAAAVAELARGVETLGCVGACVGTNVNGTNWDAPELFPVLEAAADLGVMVFVHPQNARYPARDHPYHLQNLTAFPFETMFALASLLFGGVLDRLPTLRVCLAHGGGYACMGLGRLDHGHAVRAEAQTTRMVPSAYASRVWFDSLTHSDRALRLVLDVAGVSQVVVGTDFPADMAQDRPVDWIEATDLLTAEEKERVLRTNVQILLGPAAVGRLMASA
jgi:aminocarboxymuconate-semialdehyde decarboxylase